MPVRGWLRERESLHKQRLCLQICGKRRDQKGRPEHGGADYRSTGREPQGHGRARDAETLLRSKALRL